MNRLQYVSIVVCAIICTASGEYDPKNDYVRAKRNGDGWVDSGSVSQPRSSQYYNYPSDYNSNYYRPAQSKTFYYPSSSSSSWGGGSYYPSSSYYNYYQKPVAPTPANYIKSIISRHDGPLNPYGYKNPNAYGTRPPRKKKKRLFVPNVWG